ncbi:MAG: Nramp family divalent metal transporter [Janthinobacterium lividum]
MAPDGTTLSERTADAAQRTLRGERRGVLAMLPFFGPAVIASVAYMDPGNFATNIQAGAGYGYELLWVVVLANLVAMLFQSLSARLGIVTGRNLAELCRTHFRHRVVIAMWLASEAAAIATDLAEFLGCAIGLSLLTHLPLMGGMVVTGIATYALLELQRRGFRPLEMMIGVLVAAIALSYVVELVIAPPDWGAVAYHAVVPRLRDAGAVTLAVGTVGATVMPHAIYLHSGLMQDRIRAGTEADRRRLIRFSDIEVLVALGAAGLVNMAMVAMAATAFHDGVHNGIAEIETAYTTLGPLLGSGAAAVFAVSLVASGLSSSAVGTMAGQVIMQGFVGFRIPLWVRRSVTMAPAFAIVAMGFNPTQVLIASQVALSLALPLPMIALLLLVRRPDVMGGLVPRRATMAATIAATAVVLALNTLLVAQVCGIVVPGLG